MNDEQMQPLLDTWYRDREVAPRDVQAGVARVMAQVPQTRQQGRWWPLPVFRRKAQTPTTTDTTGYQPSPILATNGHAPTVIGRTQTMFSPVKAITAGALVFALGGLFLVAQPFDQGGSVPGAEQGAEPAPPVKVTITVTRGTGESIDEGCTSDTPEVCTSTWPPDQWSATDPRLSGSATHRAAEKWWPTGGEFQMYPVFEAYAVEVVNDEGRWVGTGRATGPLGGLYVVTLTGEGAHEGLTAVVAQDPSDSDNDGITTNLAVIVEGELPPFPELPAE